MNLPAFPGWVLTCCHGVPLGAGRDVPRCLPCSQRRRHRHARYIVQLTRWAARGGV